MDSNPLALTEVSPRFRSDLKVERKGPGVFTVKAPEAATAFTLYDFELSLARMLDGRRTHAEVVEAGLKIGIPINLETLGKFIRQMKAYHFIAEREAVPSPADQTTWQVRETWDESVRELFQSGLRLARQGRYGEARAYFEAILELDPQNPEAIEKREEVLQLERQARVGEPMLQEQAAPEVEVLEDVAPPFARPPRWRWVAGGLGVAVAVSMGLFAFLRQGAPPPLASPAVAVPPTEAQPPTPEPQPPRAQYAEVRILGSERLTLRKLTAPAAGTLNWAAPDQGRVGREQVVATVESVAPAGERALKLLDARIAKLQRLSEKHSVYDAFLRKAKLQRARLHAKHLQAHPLPAVQDGLLIRGVAEGAVVQAGDEVGRLDALEVWSFQLEGEGKLPAEQTRCEVISLRLVREAPCSVLDATPTADGRGYTASISARVDWPPERDDLRFRFVTQ